MNVSVTRVWTAPPALTWLMAMPAAALVVSLVLIVQMVSKYWHSICIQARNSSMDPGGSGQIRGLLDFALIQILLFKKKIR